MAMTILYKPAPGCAFPGTPYKTSFVNHLHSKRSCPCKDVGWTVDQAKTGSDGRANKMSKNSTVVPPILYALTASDNRPVVEMRIEDGYVNATRMCQAANRLCKDFMRLDNTQTFLKALAAKGGYDPLNLIQSNHGGSTPGTWVHPQVAIKLAAWCSPDFEVAVTDLVHRYSKGEVTTEESCAVAGGLTRAAAESSGERLQLNASSDIQETVERGIYIGRPNGDWTSLTTPGQVSIQVPEDGVVLKFGCSENCSRRIAEHQRDYKGFHLLDWKSTNDCRASENSLRNSLRMENKLVQGINSNKQKPEKELVIVRSVQEYEKLRDDMCKHAEEDVCMRHMELVTKQMELTTQQMTETTKQKQIDFDILKFKQEHGLLS